jgi:hypothetical protein
MWRPGFNPGRGFWDEVLAYAGAEVSRPKSVQKVPITSGVKKMKIRVWRLT